MNVIHVLTKIDSNTKILLDLFTKCADEQYASQETEGQEIERNLDKHQVSQKNITDSVDVVFKGKSSLAKY